MAANYQQIKQTVLQLFQSAIVFTKSQHYPEIQQRLEEAQKRLIDGKLFVVICGEFKQGKSSLMNALLNERNLFPVDVDITTNLVTTISYGQREKITVVVGEPGKEQTKQLQRSEIPNYVTEQRNTHNVQQARMLAIESPNPQLKDGLVLVDTPGVGSLNSQHTAVSYAFIPNADAILFVSDALAPLSTKELEFLEERILPHCQNLIFVVTKIDAVRNYQEIVESNCEKLAQVLSRCPSEIPIVPVASTLKLAYLDSQESEDLEDSNFDALESELWKLIGERRGQLLLSHALAELGRGITEIRQPIQVQWEACQHYSQQQLDDLENQYKETHQSLQNLLESNGTWRTKLSDGLQEVRIEIQNKFQDGFTEIRRQSNKYLNDAILLESPDQIANLVEADIDSLMSSLGQQLGYLAANMHDQIENSTDLRLNPFEVDSLARDKKQRSPEDLQVKKPGIWSKIMQMTKTASSNMSVAGTIGGVAGATIGALFTGGVASSSGYLVGAAIGGALVGLIGLATGAKEGLQQIQEKTKHSVSLVIKQFIDESQGYCNRTLNKALRELEISMRDELAAQIKREKDNCERTLHSLQETRQLSSTQAAQKVKDLQLQLQQLTQMQKDAEKLAELTINMALPARQQVKPPTFSAKSPTTPQPKVSVGADSGDWADA